MPFFKKKPSGLEYLRNSEVKSSRQVEVINLGTHVKHVQCFFLLDVGHRTEQRKAISASNHSIACAQLSSFKPMPKLHKDQLPLFSAVFCWKESLI